jgi:hypothetical protein
MKYYIFEPAVDTPETGSVYPQVYKMASGYNYKAENSVHALSKATKAFPNYTPNLDYFILDGRAKLTDLLSVGVMYGGFLVSGKLKELLQQFSLPPHRFYSARVLHKKGFYDYYWMHIICDLTNVVDYPKSKFIIYYNYAHNLGSIEINTKEELYEKREKLKQDNLGKNVTVWSDKIVLNGSFDKHLDFFEIGSFDSSYYISEKLKVVIEKEKFTGISIKRTEKIFV